ncbi:Lipase/thioesterase family protein [Taphrina deformans PYCC 5710]|uniref:Lipase/thioesterase family protein n=1 Tax=Taphrina deformans (strain PYCC 5710 / ATCC 11124 / CBS 356.35 / IMI 108563 / JCM 9778 / NBRC 8474) TaxID=1097556 RepID=R4X804_TAPDE|nr:Lipase/thioesterase family protein [Taphrina deformans PYCC 5710]|eukprot:CCG81615.1 Lipase/thioesterase family protein [Taphrina deformans PYCC 5710]
MVRFIFALDAQCRLYRRAHYKRIQRGSVKGVWFADNAARKSEEQIAQGSGPVILYCHGGAFISGQAKMYSDWFIDMIQDHKKHYNKDLTIFSLDYTLAPDKTFPHQWHQYNSAIDYLTRTMRVDLARLFFAGDSAGGNLTLQTLFEYESSQRLAGAILFSPWVLPGASLALQGLCKDKQGHEPNKSHSWHTNAKSDFVTDNFGNLGIKAFVEGGISFEEAYDSPQINPQLRTAEEFRRLPDMLVVYGESERLKDQILEFVDKAKANCESVDVIAGPGGVHIWPLQLRMNQNPAHYHKAIQDVSAWVEKKMIHA